MESITAKIIRPILAFLARLTILRYRPKIVGVTGSVGKTSTIGAIVTVLAKTRNVRMPGGNFNNEIGMSLSILGDWSEREIALVSRDQSRPGGTKFRKLCFWLKVFFVGAWRVAVRSKRYPKVLVLEYGADRPGDILRLMRIARPDVGVVTAVGDAPAHVEFYANPEAVAREKGRLIERLSPGQFAILNHDDDTVDALRDRTRGRVTTYGFDAGADLRIVRFEYRTTESIPVGISFKFEYEGSSVPVRIDGVLGRSSAYAAAAACIGLIFDMNLVTISEALADYVPAPSRMELLPGIKRTLVIDDSYNASPLSMRAALDTLRELSAPRKIAVLGDMLEIGKYTIEAHESIGREVAEAADALITVGARAKFIADAAREAGMKKEHIHSFDTVEEAIQPLTHSMSKGDLVLVKGSHAMGLGAVVSAITAVPLATEEA